MTSTGIFTAEVRIVGAQPYLGRRLHAPMASVGPLVQEAFAALYRHLAETGTPTAGPPFLIAQEPQGGFLDLEVGAPCTSLPASTADFEAGLLPAGRVAVTVYRGPYDRLGDVYPQLAAWISDRGLQMAGPPREVYLTPPGEDPVTEVVWPVSGGDREE